MELRAYLSILWRRKWIVIFAVLATTIVASVGTLLVTPTYASTTILRVATIGGGVVDFGRTDINYTQLLMSTYTEIITSSSVKNELRQQFELDANPKITAELVPNTELMRIRVETSDPAISQVVADAAAQILIARSRELYNGTGETTQEILGQQLNQIEAELEAARAEYDQLLQESPDDVSAISAANLSIELKERTQGTLLEQYEQARLNEALRANAVSVVEPANFSRSQASPRYDLNIALGVLVGLVGGVGLAFVMDNLDSTLYTTKQIEDITRLSTLGKIPSAVEDKKLVSFTDGYHPELEAFRRLRTNIFSQTDVAALPQTLMVTSAERGEGKSTITANLAITIAQSGRSVVVIDGDMRLPKLHEIFDLSNKRGLTNVLVEEMDVTEAIQSTTHPRVSLLSSGPLPPNPTELLGSPQMMSLIEEMKAQFDIVLLDTPALLSVSDAAVLVPSIDNVVLVVAREYSNRNAVQAVRDQLNNVRAKSVGVVVNRAELNGMKRAY